MGTDRIKTQFLLGKLLLIQVIVKLMRLQRFIILTICSYIMINLYKIEFYNIVNKVRKSGYYLVF